MIELVSRDVEYAHDSTRMIGFFCAPQGVATPLPGVIVVHGAHGLDEAMETSARRLAQLGYAVLAADLWGERRLLNGDDEVGAMLDGLVGDRDLWMARVRAAHAALADQPEVDAGRIAGIGYCFGGSSVLEYVRAGGAVAGVVSLHGGLELVSTEWKPVDTGAHVLLCTGSEDPIAPVSALLDLQTAMSGAGVDWEVDVYGGAKHAFTDRNADMAGRPDVIAYDPRSDRRSWVATTRFLGEVLVGQS